MNRLKTLSKGFYILSFIVVLLTTILCFYPGQITYAESSGIIEFDRTAVLDDLQGMTLDGKPFDVADYPANPYGELTPLTFVEYCYSQYVNAGDVYGLYIYLWNPAYFKIDEAHVMNELTMAVEFNERDDPSKYQEFKLRFCSKTADGMFYKFKIIDSNNVMLSVVENYAKGHSGQRKYYVGEVELVTVGDTSASPYKVGKQYVYEGFSEGYGDSEHFPLTMKSLGIDTLQTNLGYAFYRPDGAVAEYSYTQNQLNSVFFSVPNSMIKKYGVLSAVHMSWYEYLTKNIFVVKDNAVIEKLSGYIGEKINPYDPDVFYTLAGCYDTSLGSEVGGKDMASITYNNYSPFCFSSNSLDILYYLFDLDDFKDGTIASGDLLKYIQTYSGSGEKLNDKYYKELFEDYVEEGRTYGFNEFTVKPDDDINLLNYTFSSEWWQLGWGTHTDNSYKDIDAIVEVKPEDFVGTTKSICEKLLIDESCYSEFKKAYDTAVNDQDKRTLFLIRFGVTNYTSYPLTVLKKSTLGYSKVDSSGYCAQQTAFLDLDVIDVTFRDENEVETVIPVVARPIDGIGSLTKPIDYDGNKNSGWVKAFIALILLVLLVVIICVACPSLIPVIIKVLLLPFRLIGAIFKAIKSMVKRE